MCSSDLAKELEWMRRMPKARTHKSKSRIEAFYDIKDKAFSKKNDAQLKLNVKMSRIGGKILEVSKLSKRYDSMNIVDSFSYIFKKGERIGILGKNGIGKTTFLNLLTGRVSADSGNIDVGETIVFGYYTQSGIQLPEDKRVIEVVKDIAEHIPAANGNSLSASQFLQHFLFPPEMQYSYVSTLSGGERRRLHLLTVLIKNPNFLILDEPTNDLDIETLAILEDFLTDYKGCLILVSHDRYFLDKLADHIFIFEGEGRIKDFYGNYTEYQNDIFEKQRQEKELKQSAKVENTANQATADSTQKKKLSYKEKREYEQLEKEISELEAEKATLETMMSEASSDYEKLETISNRIGEIIELIDTKSLRWLELSELEG